MASNKSRIAFILKRFIIESDYVGFGTSICNVRLFCRRSDESSFCIRKKLLAMMTYVLQIKQKNVNVISKSIIKEVYEEIKDRPLYIVKLRKNL